MEYGDLQGGGGRDFRDAPEDSLASPTPIVTADRLFVHFGHMGSAALDLAGKVVWKQTSIPYEPTHGNGGSPVLAGGLLIFSCDAAPDPILAAIDAVTGEIRWKTPRDTTARKKFSFSTPLVVGDQVISPGSGHGAVFVVSNNPPRQGSVFSVTGPLKVGSPAQGGGTGLLRITDANSTVEVFGDVFVAATGRIDGRGTLSVTGTLHNSGFIEPGLSPGVLTVEGNFEQDATGVIVAEVGGATPGTQHDKFIVTGTSVMGGKLILQFINGYAPKAGEHFDVLNTTGAATGAFAEVEVGGLEPGAAFQTAMSGGTLTATAMSDTTALQTVSIHAVGKKAFEKRRRSSALLISRKGTKASKVNPLTVTYAISGTAENGIDYTLLSGTVTIPAGKSAVALKLTPFDDSTPEVNETAEFRIIPGADYSNSLRSTAQVTIVNNSRPKR